MNSIYAKLVGSVLPVMFPLRDEHTKEIIEEFPLAEVMEIHHDQDFTALRIRFVGEVCNGKRLWVSPKQVMAF